jgi:hypothetical protein
MNAHGAPPSLAMAADRRQREAATEELLTHSRQLERNIRHTLKVIEVTKDFDPQWLAAARVNLNIGVMCLNRAITRQDFF